METRSVQQDTRRIAALAELGQRISNRSHGFDAVISKSAAANGWFDAEESLRMADSFSGQFLQAEALTNWISAYPAAGTTKQVGLVLAGNVPFVGMHDVLSVLMSGHGAKIKLSSKDSYFFPWMQEQLHTIDAATGAQMQFVERLEQFDAVIATGSNNSARYFTYYFGKYPHIIRKNRTSVAVIYGNETPEQLHALGKDVFYYYGLGCRNVGKVFIPKEYDLQNFFKYWTDYEYVIENTKYKHNYDYNRALLLLNKTSYLTNDFYMLVESDQLFSPLSVLFYETYADEQDLQQKMQLIADDLQCVVADKAGNTPFGRSQFPGLTDYADHVDTMQFLSAL